MWLCLCLKFEVMKAVWDNENASEQKQEYDGMLRQWWNSIESISSEAGHAIKFNLNSLFILYETLKLPAVTFRVCRSLQQWEKIKLMFKLHQRAKVRRLMLVKHVPASAGVAVPWNASPPALSIRTSRGFYCRSLGAFTPRCSPATQLETQSGAGPVSYVLGRHPAGPPSA